MTKELRGVITILAMPFDEQGRIDVDSLCKLVNFNIDAGVHGLGIALGSEIFKLSEGERDLALREVVAQAAGQVPIVVNTGAAGTDLALHYSRRAQELGADALMIFPPSFMPASAAEVRAYYKAISAGVEIPIVIQDFPDGPVPPPLVRQIVAESERVQYVKVEVHPTTERLSQGLEATGGRVGMFGGAGGNYLIEELRRGAIGTMPASSQPGAFVRLWDHFQAGSEDRAEEIFYGEILPLLRLTLLGSGVFFQLTKELLRRRGVINTAYVRAPFTPMDEATAGEANRLVEQLLEMEADSGLS